MNVSIAKVKSSDLPYPRHTSFIPLSFLEAQRDWGWHMYALCVGEKIIGYMSLSKEEDDVFELIRQKVFELFAKGDLPGLIFTYMCAFDMQNEFDYLEGVIDLFKENGAKCCVVELCADFEEHLVRNKSENRLLHKEIEA